MVRIIALPQTTANEAMYYSCKHISLLTTKLLETYSHLSILRDYLVLLSMIILPEDIQ